MSAEFSLSRSTEDVLNRLHHTGHVQVGYILLNTCRSLEDVLKFWEFQISLKVIYFIYKIILNILASVRQIFFLRYFQGYKVLKGFLEIFPSRVSSRNFLIMYIFFWMIKELKYILKRIQRRYPEFRVQRRL